MNRIAGDFSAPAREYSGWLIPLAVFVVTAILSALFLAYYFAPSPQQLTRTRPAPTDSGELIMLSIAGIVDSRQMVRATPYAVLGIFVIGAVLTPPDPVSQVFLALPLLGLYALGIGVAWLFEGRKKSTTDTATSSQA